MNQALVQDVVAEVMKRIGDRRPGGTGSGSSAVSSSHRPATGVRAGEDAPANEPQRKATYAQPHSSRVPIGEHGIFSNVDEAVAAGRVRAHDDDE